MYAAIFLHNPTYPREVSGGGLLITGPLLIIYSYNFHRNSYIFYLFLRNSYIFLYILKEFFYILISSFICLYMPKEFLYIRAYSSLGGKVQAVTGRHRAVTRTPLHRPESGTWAVTGRHRLSQTHPQGGVY